MNICSKINFFYQNIHILCINCIYFVYILMQSMNSCLFGIFEKLYFLIYYSYFVFLWFWSQCIISIVCNSKLTNYRLNVKNFKKIKIYSLQTQKSWKNAIFNSLYGRFTNYINSNTNLDKFENSENFILIVCKIIDFCNFL